MLKLRIIRIAAISVLCQLSAAPLLAAVPEDATVYKCYGVSAAGAAEISYFETARELPKRFGEETPAGSVDLPDAVQDQGLKIIECVQDGMTFRNREALRLEQQSPR